jgi:hypothetical protein
LSIFIQEEFMNKGRKSWLVALAATAVLMTACGGGGGGGGDNSIAAAAYTGVDTQTYLAANNAEALVQGAYGLDYQTIIPLATGNLGVTGGSAASTINSFHLSTLTKQTVAILKQDFQVKPQALLDPATACSNYPAGTASDTLVESSSNTTVTMKGNITFSNCDLGGGVIFDGNIGLSMSMNLDTLLLTQLSMTMNPITVDDGGATYTLNGEMNGSETIDNSGFLVSHLTLNITLEDSTGQSFWLNNYKIDNTEESSGTRSTISGRYYDNDYGFVDFNTIETIYVPYNPFEATYAGLITFVGREGTHANLRLGENQNDYCINVFNASGIVNLGTCAQ